MKSMKKKSKCTDYNKTFKAKSELYKHVNSMHEKSYKCGICGVYCEFCEKTFTCLKKMRFYKCDICERMKVEM